MGRQRENAEQCGSQLLTEPFGGPSGDGGVPGGHMCFTTFEVIAMGMVHGVASCPAVVRHQQCTVERKPHHALNLAVGMERIVPAFMGQHPAAHGHRAGDERIDQPNRDERKRERDLRSGSVLLGYREVRLRSATPCERAWRTVGGVNRAPETTTTSRHLQDCFRVYGSAGCGLNPAIGSSGLIEDEAVAHIPAA